MLRPPLLHVVPGLALLAACGSASPCTAAETIFSGLGMVPASAAPQARQCLADAIAYEAGYESVEGRRAVAEVILNRTRSGVHPATVCGVVYEGSARSTGCQFTFTCDGSLRRRLPSRIMEEAGQIADEALAGAFPMRLAGALNYHADYVYPYWARTMQRIVQIGRHIFYRPARTAILPVRGSGRVDTGLVESARPVSVKPTDFTPWGLSLNAQK